MATYYVDPTNGNDADDGLSWANAFLTLNGAEDEPVAAGDVVYVGPGVYRETLTCDVSGANPYSTGTVSVTNGSDQVTGNGTTFGGNVAADYLFHVRLYDNGADGVCNGTATFTAAGGNFQASMVGCPIQILTRGAYTIAAVAAANSITLADPAGLGWPAALDPATYSVMSGEAHYDIESQDDNTTLTLKQPWQGKTLTGLSYLTFNPITYIADVTGENTDDVGGVARITGSDDDQGTDRANGIDASGEDYRVFRGFRLDTVSAYLVDVNASNHIVVEDVTFGAFSGTAGIWITGASSALSARRCLFWAQPYIMYFDTNVDDSGHVIENCSFLGSHIYHIRGSGVGGITFRNVLLAQGTTGLRTVGTAMTTGQTIYFVNSILMGSGKPLSAANSGEIIEDYNTFFANGTDRTNVGIGPNSQTYPPLMVLPILHAGEDRLSGFRFPPPLMGELSEWSQLQIAGVDERNTDLLGIQRPVTAAKNSWGAMQIADVERETGTVHAGSVSMVLHDAGRHQIWVPVTATSTTISVYVYREANYAGTNPQMIVKQPGQADDITTDANAASQWNLLTTTLTPAANPPYVVVELVSNNTNGANDKVFFDDLVVS